MTQAHIYTGTGEELAARARQFRDRKNLTLIVPAEETPDTAPAIPHGVDRNHFYFRATPEEFNRALDEIAAMNEDTVPPPPEAYDRENLYDERF